LAIEEKANPTRRGRPPGKPSIEARVLDACARHWAKGKQTAIKGVRIPEAGAAELLLLGGTEGTLIVIARSWPHAAAFAHVVGQAIGDVAHFIAGAHGDARDFTEACELAPPEKRKLGTRLASDAAAGKLGIVFAIGFTDQDGDDPVRKRLLPVVTLLDEWAEHGAKGLSMGVHLWSVRLGDDDEAAKVEPMQLRGQRARKTSG
jgi:hypothetical protein